MLPPVVQFRPYQQRYVDETARFMLAVKSARVGLSFASGARNVLKRLARGKTTTVLSASKAQSIEYVENVQKIVKAMGAVAELYEEPFADIDGATSFTQSRVQFPGSGGRIIALPANPRTARGYPGDAVLDEFGHHQESYAIFAAIGRQVALGDDIEILSTPNGEQGKFFDLAKDLGLTDGVAPAELIVHKGAWAGHFIDVHLAIKEGCPISIEEMRDLFKDEEMFGQEFLCVFLKAQGAWIPLELVARCEHDEATTELPGGFNATGPMYGGIDVARDRDQTVMWLDEQIGDVSWTRAIVVLRGMPLTQQARLLAPYVDLCSKVAIDATGMGVGLYDILNEKFAGRVLGVNFAGTNDHGVKLKTDLAVRIKKKLEEAKSRIPRDQDVRTELMAIKREATSTGVKFDAPRIELDTAIAGGKRKKLYGHADRFWAKALADLAGAAAAPAYAATVDVEVQRGERRGIMSPTNVIGAAVQRTLANHGLAHERRSILRG